MSMSGPISQTGYKYLDVHLYGELDMFLNTDASNKKGQNWIFFLGSAVKCCIFYSSVLASIPFHAVVSWLSLMPMWTQGHWAV